MEREYMYNAAYSGSKGYTQHEVKTANANGFAAAADDYAERGIDLNEQLILNKPATFFFRMNGDAMTGAGISSGDVLIVDRSIKATNGKIAVIAVNGDLMVRRIQPHLNGVSLQADNPRYSNIELTEFADMNIWGVVTCVIHILESRLLTHNNNHNKNPKHKSEDFRVLY
jgi:DNA polymerase V